MNFVELLTRFTRISRDFSRISLIQRFTRISVQFLTAGLNAMNWA